MRLIDADALKKTFEAWRERLMQKAEMKLDVMNVWATARQIELIDAAIDELERMPEIREEPVRRGQWVKRKGARGAGVFVCSVCNSVAQSSYSEYCPGCGAKMNRVTHKPQSVTEHRTHTLYTECGRVNVIVADEPEFLMEFYDCDANGGQGGEQNEA